MTILRGKMSTFGGPNDKGVRYDEDLAVIWKYEQKPTLFLKIQPHGTTGLARRLDPDQLYLACRWDYKETSISWLLENPIWVMNPKTGKNLAAQAADWGPNEKTGRIADLSPGLAKSLGLETNDICEVYIKETPKGQVSQTNNIVVLPQSNSTLIANTVVFPILTQTPTLATTKVVWPLQSQASEFYGNPSTQNWLHNNTIDVKCPWRLRMGYLVIPYILFHKNVRTVLPEF